MVQSVYAWLNPGSLLRTLPIPTDSGVITYWQLRRETCTRHGLYFSLTWRMSE